MAIIQQSIDINVPVQTVYNQLTQFEDYPRFFDNVERVQQMNDTHLHWTTKMANRPVEWDAEITQQETDHCIAWHNTSGPHHTGKVEVQALNPEACHVTFTFDAEPGQFPGLVAGDSAEEMAQQLRQNLARLKDFAEARGSETGAWRGEINHGIVTASDRHSQDTAGASSPSVRQTLTRPSPASVSGSPTEVLEDEPNEAGPGGPGGATAAGAQAKPPHQNMS